MIKTSHEGILEQNKEIETLRHKLAECTQQLEIELKKQRINNPTRTIENEKIQHIKNELGKKISEYQLEIENLRDYIKKKSHEETQKRLNEKQKYDYEVAKYKTELGEMKTDHENRIKEY